MKRAYLLSVCHAKVPHPFWSLEHSQWFQLYERKKNHIFTWHYSEIARKTHHLRGHLSYKNTTLLHLHIKFTIINRWLKSANQARECFQDNIWVCQQAAIAANISPLENISPLSDMVVQACDYRQHLRGWEKMITRLGYTVNSKPARAYNETSKTLSHNNIFPNTVLSSYLCPAFLGLSF